MAARPKAVSLYLHEETQKNLFSRDEFITSANGNITPGRGQFRPLRIVLLLHLNGRPRTDARSLLISYNVTLAVLHVDSVAYLGERRDETTACRAALGEPKERPAI